MQELCQLTVSDNGIGFDEKYLDRIFNVFQRLHSRGEFEGNGMGLAIVKKIALYHCGDITAKSKPGTGTTFILTLPVTHHKNNETHN
jgi:signal transduction histidine kinase